MKLALATLFLCAASEAWAQAQVRLLAYPAPASWPEAEGRIVAELSAAGFGVQRREIPVADWPPVMAADTDQDVVAVVAVSPRREQGRIQIAISDRVTQKQTLRALNVSGRETADAAAVALEVVELLHASLLEVKLRPAAPAPPVVREKVQALLATPPPPERWRVQAGFGPSLGWVPLGPGLPYQGQFGVHLTLAPPRGLTYTLDVRVPVRSGRVQVGADAADVRATTGRLFADLQRRGRWRPFGGLGLGVVTVESNGTAGPGSIASSGRRWAGVASARGGLAVSVGSWMTVTGWTAVSAFVPEVDINFNGQPGARLGFPQVEVGLSIGIGGASR